MHGELVVQLGLRREHLLLERGPELDGGRDEGSGGGGGDGGGDEAGVEPALKKKIGFSIFLVCFYAFRDLFFSPPLFLSHARARTETIKNKEAEKKKTFSKKLALTLTSGPKIAPSAAGAGCGTQKTAKWRLRRLGMSFLPSRGVCIAAM